MPAEIASSDARIREWRRRFQLSPLARDVVAQLAGRAEEIWRGTFDLLRKESPEYRNAVDDEFTIESKSHCGELLETIIAIAAGRARGPDPFAFVRRHAEWRARHQVPLVASLHAYRLAHKTYWGITRQSLARHRREKEALRAMAMLSDFWIELFESVGAVLEESHGAEEARIVAQNKRAHAVVIDDLLSGAESTGHEARQLLALFGIRPGKKLTVALLQPFTDAAKQVDNEVAARSIVRLLHEALPSSAFGKLVGHRNGEIVVIACSDEDTSALLVRCLNRAGIGKRGASPVVRVGVGLDKVDIASLPEALGEARIALGLTHPGRAAIRFSDIDLSEAVIHRADRTLLRLVPDWIRTAHATGRERHLLRTISAFAECSLNVKETAARLDVHTNTVYFRLNQIQKRTGVDPRTFAGASFLLTSLRLLENSGGASGAPG
jgi:sugar diacid utilization regulator